MANYRRSARFLHLGPCRRHEPGLDFPTVPSSLRSVLVDRVRAAARDNARPALLMLGVAAALLLGWAFWPAAHEALDRLMALKLAWGLGYSFLTGALFAGLLPRLVMHATGQGRGARGPVVAELVFAMGFWGWRGIEIDAFYHLQAQWFGEAASWRAVLAKTAVDQFVYSPLWAVPEIALAYAWKDAGFSLRRLRAQLDRDFLALRLPSAMLGNAMVWLPAVIVVYLLPTALQQPVSNLVATFWVLLMVVLLSRDKPPAEPTPAVILQDTM